MTSSETISNYINELCGQKPETYSTNMFETGLLTSLDVLSLVSFIEEKFSVTINGDEIDMDSFGTVEGMATLVDSLRTQPA